MSFFIWDEFIDPGKSLQCPGCGALLGEESVQSDENEERYVGACPDCGMVNRLGKNSEHRGRFPVEETRNTCPVCRVGSGIRANT